jgi:hypothetical protein
MSNDSVNQYLAKTFGEKAFGREVLMLKHPQTNDIFIFGALDEPQEGRVQAYVVDEYGVVDNLGEICVTFNECNASFLSLKYDFDISVSIDTGVPNNAHYMTMDGCAGPVMDVMKAGMPGVTKKSAPSSKVIAM